MAATKENGALVSVKFAFDKETKGTVRYQEEGHAPVIGTLYLRKSHFAKPEYPQSLTVTVTVNAK